MSTSDTVGVPRACVPTSNAIENAIPGLRSWCGADFANSAGQVSGDGALRVWRWHDARADARPKLRPDAPAVDAQYSSDRSFSDWSKVAPTRRSRRRSLSSTARYSGRAPLLHSASVLCFSARYAASPPAAISTRSRTLTAQSRARCEARPIHSLTARHQSSPPRRHRWAAAYIVCSP